MGREACAWLLLDGEEYTRMCLCKYVAVIHVSCQLDAKCGPV